MSSESIPVPVPTGDHPVVVEHLARSVLQTVMEALSDLDTALSVHVDVAPVSAEHVRRYVSAVACETLLCIERWPS